MNNLVKNFYRSVSKLVAAFSVIAILSPIGAQAANPIIINPSPIPGYNPVVQNLIVTPEPFVLGVDQVKFAYKINAQNAVNITATVYPKSTPSKVVMTWKGSNNPGDNKIIWDGLDDTYHKFVNPGDYQFKIAVASPSETQTLDFVIKVDNCAGYNDVKTTDKDCKAITYVKSLGAMTGYTNGNFGPDDTLYRDQIAKIVLTTFKLFDPKQDYCLGKSPFPDVPAAEWSYQYICRGKDLKIITGYLSGVETGLYLPHQTVNRAEFLALVLRNLSNAMPPLSSTSYDDVPANQWFSGYAKFAYTHNLFAHPKLYPNNATLRREVARVIYTLHSQGEL